MRMDVINAMTEIRWIHGMEILDEVLTGLLVGKGDSEELTFTNQ